LRVLLLNPPFSGRVSQGRYNRAWPPLDLLNAAALLERAGHSVRLLDGRARPSAFGRLEAEANWAELIVLDSSPLDRWQCPNLELEPVIGTAGRLKGRPLFVCGVQGTLFPEEVLGLTGAAGVIRGEPEGAVLDLAQGRDPEEVTGLTFRRSGRAAANPDRPPLDLAGLPRPAYHLVDLKDYGYELLGPRLGLIETGRGCPFECAFCLKVMYPGRLRSKPVGQVLDEVDHLVRERGARSVYFIDLEFTARRPAVVELCQGLIRRGLNFRWACQTRLDQVDEDLLRLMKRAGLRLIHFGLETASLESLARAGKLWRPEAAGRVLEAARRLGLVTAGFFMVGLPGEGLKEARATLDLALRLKPSLASFHAHTPYPGTGLGLAARSWTEWSRQAREGERRWALFLRRAYLRYYLRPAGLAAGWRVLRAGGGLGPLRLWLGFLK